MRCSRTAISWLIVVGLTGPFVEGRARAQTPSDAPASRALVEVTWDAPPGCSSARDVEARVARLVGHAKPPDTPLRADATLSRNDDGFWSLGLIIHAGTLVGERQMTGKSCSDLAGAVAVTLALLLSSDRPLQEADLSEEQKAPAPAPAARAAPPPPAPHPSPSPSVRWHALIGFPLASLRVAPSQAWGGGAAFAGGLSYGRWSWSLQERVWLRQTLSAPELSGAGADLRRVDATLWTCHALVSAPLEVQPCLTLGLQHLVASGSGPYVASRTAKATWFSGGIGAKVGYRATSWLRLQLGVDGQFQASRPRIIIDDVGTIGQLPRADLTITLGPEWIL